MRRACYKREDGTVVRFDTESGEYVAGIPSGRLITFFKPKWKNGIANIANANIYFNAEKKEMQDETDA